MRISTLQAFNNAVDQMQKGQTELARTQQKIASGKELLRPSDDPVAASQILKLNREVARIDKFEENIEVTDRRLQLEEMTLEQINTSSDRLKELTIQAGSGVLTDADRSFIAAEVRQLQDQLLGLMNTKDTAGEYLFAGSKGFTPPFVKTGDTFQYQGDDAQRFIQVGPELRIASTDSGRDVFQVIPGKVESVRAFGLDTTVVGNLSVADPDLYSGDLKVTIQDDGAGGYLYTVSDTNGQAVAGESPPITLENIPFSATQSIEAGGLAFDVNVPGGGVTLPAEVTLRGQRENHSILQTAQDLITTLETPLDSSQARQDYTADLAKIHDELNIAKEGSLRVRTQLGARMNSVEAAAGANADFKLFTETALSQLQDLDYARAISEFSLQETALQASQATFSRISKLSLFDFL